MINQKTINNYNIQFLKDGKLPVWDIGYLIQEINQGLNINKFPMKLKMYILRESSNYYAWAKEK